MEYLIFQQNLCQDLANIRQNQCSLILNIHLGQELKIPPLFQQPIKAQDQELIII